MRSSSGCLWRLGLSVAAFDADLIEEAKTVGLVPLGGPLTLLLSAMSAYFPAGSLKSTNGQLNELAAPYRCGGSMALVEVVVKSPETEIYSFDGVCSVCSGGRWSFMNHHEDNELLCLG